MNFETTSIPGLYIIQPQVYQDARGFFFESWNAREFAEQGLAAEWVQDNHARSAGGTVRGLHFQRGRGQAKLIRCAAGAIWDVAVDIRPGSPTFSRWYGHELSAENHTMLYVPAGFAHGYAALSESAETLYKCDRLYDPAIEDGFKWNDPEVGVAWPVADPILSARDQSAQSFKEFVAKQAAPDAQPQH